MATVTDLETTNYIENLDDTDKALYNAIIITSSENIEKNKRQYARNKAVIFNRRLKVKNILDKYTTKLAADQTEDTYSFFKQGVSSRREAIDRSEYVEKINSYINILMDTHFYKNKLYTKEYKELTYRYTYYTSLITSLESADSDFTDFTGALG